MEMPNNDSIIFTRKLTKAQNFPVENISLCRYGNNNFRVGMASMQGFRNQMEDSHVAVTQLPHHPNVGLFGVFDGHKGSRAACWFSKNVPPAIDQLTEFTEESLKNLLSDLDQKYLASTGDVNSGTTAIICIIEISDSPDTRNRVLIANIGDSLLYVGRAGTPQFRCMTKDHKPSNPEEKTRIVAAGGNVYHGRVDALLAVSRALGDHAYKGRADLPHNQQKIIAVPDVICIYLERSEYLFICCDGIMEPTQFVEEGTGIFNFLHEKYMSNNNKNWEDTAQILAELIQRLLKSGSRDNMTAMIVEFKDGKDYDRGEEFLAGEFYGEYGNSTYVDAYKSDCERNGKTVDEVRYLWSHRSQTDLRSDFVKSLGDDL